MFVDYAGEKLTITDRKSGVQRPVEVFVAILGASELTYVEATPSQEKREWIRSNERAFWWFNGVTAALVPDNLASAVSHANYYEPGINPSFDDFAAHYGTVIIPTRVREARDKGTGGERSAAGLPAYLCSSEGPGLLLPGGAERGNSGVVEGS